MRATYSVVLIVLCIVFASCGGSSNSGSGGGGGGGNLPPSSYNLTVIKSSADAGTITSVPAGIDCGPTCTTQTASFDNGAIVTLLPSVNPNQGTVFTGWNGGNCNGTLACDVHVSADTSVSATFTLVSQNSLGVYLVTDGGTTSQFLGYDSSGNGISVDTTTDLLSVLLPGSKQWILADQNKSTDSDKIDLIAFEQNDQVFEVQENSDGCSFATVFNPKQAPLTSFDIHNESSSQAFGCLFNHLDIVGDSVYYVRPSYYDPFVGDTGGEFFLSKDGTETKLLERNDPDNGAAADLADNGTLYAIFHDSTNATLTVWTRDLATGKLSTQLRHYDVDEAFYKSFWFAVNNNILYFMVDYSDDTMELWNTDLSVPLLNQTVPTVLQTYSPSTVGNAGSIALWGVDNGHVVFAFSPPDSQKGTTVAEFDAATGQTNYYDLGPDTTVKSLAPVWLPVGGSNSAASRIRSAGKARGNKTVRTVPKGIVVRPSHEG